MKHLVILSGKGGTGKTAVAAGLAQVAAEMRGMGKLVLADADVDASNLALLVGNREPESGEFRGGTVAHIDPETCTGCAICNSVCRFQAIHPVPGEELFQVDPFSCEGCAACFYQCPFDAIQRIPRMAGRWFHSRSRYGPLFHARLGPGQENSGKLVTLVKDKARAAAIAKGAPLVLMDGPPGIGCPAIAASTDAEVALIVTEPTVSGIHDLQRILELTAHFRVQTLVTVNKGDLNPEGRKQIEALCKARKVTILPWIPFQESVTESLMNGLPVTEYDPESAASLAIRQIWEELEQRLTKSRTVPLKISEVPA